MVELIVITRDQYRADIQSAAQAGAEIAIRQVSTIEEWLTSDEAMAFLRIKTRAGFVSHRKKHKIYGKDKVQTVGNRKLFNKKYLV